MTVTITTIRAAAARMLTKPPSPCGSVEMPEAKTGMLSQKTREKKIPTVLSTFLSFKLFHLLFHPPSKSAPPSCKTGMDAILCRLFHLVKTVPIKEKKDPYAKKERKHCPYEEESPQIAFCDLFFAHLKIQIVEAVRCPLRDTIEKSFHHSYPSIRITAGSSPIPQTNS